MPAPHDTHDTSGAFLVEARSERLLFTRLRGRITRELALQARDRFDAVIERLADPVWVSDASRLTGFDPSALSLGAHWFQRFKERGGRHCLVVSQWEKAMMAARTMALGLGVRIENFLSEDEALARATRILDSSRSDH